MYRSTRIDYVCCNTLKTLKYTATHCNTLKTLQYTAIHCNTYTAALLLKGICKLSNPCLTATHCVLQCVAVCCSVLQSRLLQHVLQCVAVCCSQTRIWEFTNSLQSKCCSACIAVYCSVLQCLQCVAATKSLWFCPKSPIFYRKGLVFDQ